MDNRDMKDIKNQRASVQPLREDELEKVTGGAVEEDLTLERCGTNNLLCSYCGVKTPHMLTSTGGWACSKCGTPYKKKP